MSVPEPYYFDDLVTLYHHDATELLQWMANSLRHSGLRFDCVLTDPPYGIAAGSAFVRNGGTEVAECGEASFNALIPEEHWIYPCTRMLRDGGYFATFYDVRRTYETEAAIKLHGLNMWRRFYLVNPAPPPTPRPTFQSGVQECAVAWKGEKREWFSGGAVPNFWIGVPATRDKFSEHPAEKPLEAMILLLNALCVPGGTVLDPFAGSGTTLRAAQITGRRAVGIEIDEAHCERIARRLSQSVRSDPSQPVLF